jgi:hypothetical protein
LFVVEDAAKLDSVKRAVLDTGVLRSERVRVVGERRLCELHVQPARDA